MILEEICVPIKNHLDDVENEFLKMLESDVELIDKVVAHITAYKGKRLRPILLLLCGGLRGQVTKNSIKTATIVELLHTATLIHDDVVDGSFLRRGGPSVNSVWNNKISILLGDYLFSAVLYSLSGLNDLDLIQVISEVARSMSQGELLQLEHGNNYEMEESTYFRLISNKTASLLAATCELGAVTSTPDDKAHHENMRNFGEYLGIAFQIKDDLLDFTGTEKDLGKPIAKDLIENIITLPLLYGVRKSDNHFHKKVLQILEKGVQKEDVEFIQNFAMESGGIDYAIEKAEHYTEKALACLARYDDTDFKRSLVKLTKFITTRDN